MRRLRRAGMGVLRAEVVREDWDVVLVGGGRDAGCSGGCSEGVRWCWEAGAWWRACRREAVWVGCGVVVVAVGELRV